MGWIEEGWRESKSCTPLNVRLIQVWKSSSRIGVDFDYVLGEETLAHLVEGELVLLQLARDERSSDTALYRCNGWSLLSSGT